MNATHEQLAALAALVGVTPETHQHLFKLRLHCCECGSVSWLAHGSTWLCSNMSCPAFDYGFNGAKGYKQAEKWAGEFPALDTLAGDDVFLAPLMRWVDYKHHLTTQKPVLCGRYSGDWMAGIGALMAKRGNTMTIALLRACQSAGVPEIVAIFGEVEK